jgi:methyl-accepting chemotaxis protein
MNSISIRAALTSMFAALMAAIALVGAMGLWELHQINANVVAIGTNWLPSVNATRKLQVDQSTFRIREARHILSADSDEMKKIEQQLVEARSEIEEGMKVYDKLVSSSEERTGYNKIQEGLGQYFHLHEEAIQLSRESKKDEATALFNGELTKKGIEVRGYIDTVVALNEKGAATEVDTSTELYSDAFMVLSIVIGVSLLIGCASIGFMLVRVMRPIGAMTDAMGVLAGGDTEVVIPGQGRADEIGKMANAVQIFKDNMLETERLRQEQEEAEMRSVEQRKTDMRKLADQFQRAVGGIVETVSSASTHLENAATSLTKTAETTQNQSSVVASASEETSANVQGVAAAAEQLAATVTEISRQVQQSSSIAGQAVLQATTTTQRVGELSDSATRIGDVVQLINSIAGQTNLLALNATIEAARAGDAGKGFAVVAQEVKALAAQTGKATSDIGKQIASMQAATTEAVKAIHEITATINQMSEISGTIAAAVEEQGATTQEISRNVSEAAKGTAEVACNIIDVNRGAAETGSASTQVLTSAKQLAGEGQSLRREVEAFLRSVRAA